MNWDCIVCGDEFGLNPRPTKHQGYGTLSDGQDTRFICPAHLDAITEFIDGLKAKQGVHAI